MALILTSDAILALRQGVTNLRPALQIADIQKMWNAQTAVEQFYIVLSDGVNQQSALCATPVNDKFRNNLVIKGSIVQLLEYRIVIFKNERILLVQNIEVLESKIIGDPKRLNAGEGHDAALPNPRLGPGPGGVQQSQRPARVSALVSAVKSANGCTKPAGGFGGGFNTMGQASRGPKTVTKSCLRPTPAYPHVPIANLHPWIIRARLTAKSGVEY